LKMTKANITIRNLNKSYNLNEPFIKRLSAKILAILKKRADTRIEMIFLDDSAMRALNKKYKKRNCATDVLSFKIDIGEFGHEGFLGELLISADTAFRNAEIFSTSFEEELVRYIIHAILHLFGYTDKNSKDRLRMSKKENEVLDNLCAKENLSRLLITR